MKRIGRGGISFIAAVVILIVIIVILASVVAILFVPVKSVTVDEQKSISVMSEVDSINLHSNVDIGNAQISFADLSPNLVEVDVQGTGKLSLVTSEDPVHVSLTYTLDGKALNAVASVTIDSITTGYTFSELQTNIYISKGVLTNIDSASKTGTNWLNARSGAVIGNVTMTTVTGSAKATIGSGVVLRGDIDVETTVGATYLEWSNVDLRQESTVRVAATTGEVTCNVSQSQAMHGNVSLTLQASTGAINLNMNIQASNSARVLSQTDIGGIDVTQKTGFSGPNEQLTSDNYADPTAHWFGASLATNAGGIKLNLSYLAGA